MPTAADIAMIIEAHNRLSSVFRSISENLDALQPRTSLSRAAEAKRRRKRERRRRQRARR